jgi:hypothetical protein
MKRNLLSIIGILLFEVVTVMSCYAQFYPDGGEELSANGEYTITWDKTYFDNNDEVAITIWMYKESIWRTVGSTVAKNGTFRWRVPYIQGDKFRMKVQSKRDPSRMLMSTTFFSIKIEDTIGGGNPIGAFNDDIRFEVQVSPNPTNQTVHCMWEGTNTISISVYSLTGDRMYFQPLSSVSYHTLNCSAWVNGTYTIEVLFSDGKRKVGKFLKLDS